MSPLPVFRLVFECAPDFFRHAGRRDAAAGIRTGNIARFSDHVKGTSAGKCSVGDFSGVAGDLLSLFSSPFEIGSFFIFFNTL